LTNTGLSPKKETKKKQQQGKETWNPPLKDADQTVQQKKKKKKNKKKKKKKKKKKGKEKNQKNQKKTKK